MKNKLYIMLLTVMIFTAIGGVVGCSSKDSQISDMASSLGESSDRGVGSTLKNPIFVVRVETRLMATQVQLRSLMAFQKF